MSCYRLRLKREKYKIIEIYRDNSSVQDCTHTPEIELCTKISKKGLKYSISFIMQTCIQNISLIGKLLAKLSASFILTKIMPKSG